MVVRSSNPAHLVRVDGRFPAASNNDSTDVFRLSDIKSSIRWTPHQFLAGAQRFSEEHFMRVFVQQPWSDVVEYHHEMNVRPENGSCL